jgi:hypothetical protein
MGNSEFLPIEQVKPYDLLSLISRFREIGQENAHLLTQIEGCWTLASHAPQAGIDTSPQRGGGQASRFSRE